MELTKGARGADAAVPEPPVVDGADTAPSVDERVWHAARETAAKVFENIVEGVVDLLIP